MRALLLFVFLFPFTAKSQVFTPTIAGGMGGAGRAAVDGGESAFLNPASVAHMREYYFGAHYQRGDHPREGDYSRWALQIADGTSGNLIRGSASYSKQKIDFPNGAGSRTDQDIQIGVAGIAVPLVALGLSAHYYEQSGQGRDNAQTNGTLGLIYAPSDSLGIGLVGYDIAPVSSDVLPDRRLVPTYALGFQYVYSDLLRARLDVVRPDVQRFEDRRQNVMGGIESFFANSFVFRLGFGAMEVLDETNVTASFGYHGPRLSVDYSFQKDIRSAGGARHLVDLWMPL
jgi:hypothetical protein